MLSCDQKRKKYTLFLLIVTIYLFRLCGSLPPAPWGSRELSLTERGRARQDVPKRNLVELLVQGTKVHESSKSDYNEFWSQTEDRIPESTQSKLNEPVIQKSSSWTWNKGEATQDGHQSHFPGFSGVARKVLVSSSSDSVPHASEWLAMKPVLLCDHHFMTFTASGPGFSQLLVDRDNPLSDWETQTPRKNYSECANCMSMTETLATSMCLSLKTRPRLSNINAYKTVYPKCKEFRILTRRGFWQLSPETMQRAHIAPLPSAASPISPFHLALYCGYTVRTSWSDLQMMVPYDACYITQENGSYVLPVLWWGSPLKLSCPVQMPAAAPSVPVVLCSPYGIAVHLSHQENGLPVLGVLVNGVWAPFVSAQCAYRVDSRPEEFIFLIPFIAPCLTDGLELHLVFDKQEMIFSCPFPPPPSASHQSSGAPHRPNPSTPPPSAAQEPIAQFPDHRHTTETDLPYPQIPQPSSPGLRPDIAPWFSPGGAPEAPLHRFFYPSNALPVAPESSTQDPIAQLPDYPHHAYPGFLSPTLPQVYPPASESATLPHISQDPGALLHQFQYPQNPLALPPPAPPTQDQIAQSPDNFHRVFPGFLSPHFPQVYLPASKPASPPQPAAPQAPHSSMLLDYLPIPSYPLPPVATSMRGQLPPASSPPKRPSRPHYQPPSDLYGFYNPYGQFFYPKKDQRLLPPSTSAIPGYPFPQDPIYSLSPPIEDHQQANCHPYSHTPCGSYPYPFPYSHPPYPPIQAPVPQYATELPKPTQNTVLVKTSMSPSLGLKPKVFCSSNRMRVQLPPGPISGIVFKDAKGNEISVRDAPKHCGYSASIGKDGKIQFNLQLHTRCHMIVQDNMYIMSVTYMTQSGRMEAQFYCPVSTSSSAQDCNLPREQQLPCKQGRVSQASCLSLGCCFSKHPPACFYPMDACTVDRHFVFSVPASLTEPPLSPGLLGVANNSTCKPVKVTYDYALFKLPMDGCGARRMEVGKTLIYMVEVVNTFQTISLNYGTITRDSPFRLLVECRYVPGSALTVSYLVKTPTLGPAVQTQGVFGIQLRLAKDAQYMSYYPQYHQPLQMLLGKPLYLEVRLLNAPDPSLRLLVHYCVAYSRSGSSVWVLLYNGCPNPLDPTSRVVLSDPQLPSPHAQTRRFTMSTFHFLPEGEIKDPDEEIYFMCSTEVCSPRDGPCVEGCFGH